MHSHRPRWEFRECAVAYFGFCVCIPLVRIVIYSHQAHPHTKPNGPRCTKIWENQPSAPTPRKSMIHRTLHKWGEGGMEQRFKEKNWDLLPKLITQACQNRGINFPQWTIVSKVNYPRPRQPHSQDLQGQIFWKCEVKLRSWSSKGNISKEEKQCSTAYMVFQSSVTDEILEACTWFFVRELESKGKSWVIICALERKKS